MHRNREFDRAEAGTGVSADTRTRVDYELSNLVGNLLQVLYLQLSKIGRRIYL